MSFSIDDYDLPPLRCYSDAKLFWEKTKPWRGDSDTNTRPLAKRKRNQTIRQLNDGSFACRLHSTDVVTYHPNGDVTLVGYGSVSTDAFGNRLLPNAISVSFNNAAGFVVAVYENGDCNRPLIYRMDTRLNKLTLRRNEHGTWLPIDNTATIPFHRYTLDVKKKNRAFKEYDVTGFATWVKAREAIGTPVRGYYWSYNANHHDTLQRLMKIEDWEGLYQEFGRDVMLAIKNAIYKVEDCVVVTKTPRLDSWASIRSVIVSVRKYAHLSTKGN